jgi:hypothetical protein
MIALIRLPLMSYVALMKFIKERSKAWRKTYDMSIF